MNEDSSLGRSRIAEEKYERKTSQVRALAQSRLLEPSDGLSHQGIQIIGGIGLRIFIAGSFLSFLDPVLIPESDAGADQPQQREYAAHNPNIAAVQRQPSAQKPNQHHINEQY